MNETEIFSRALRQADIDARCKFLDEACGADRALRDRLEALLAAHDDPDSFLDPPRDDDLETETWTHEDQVGRRIGPYKLLQQIGEGGMGVVYMAEQVDPVKRRVAVKIIKPGMDSKSVVARFEAERQALALMDHPNIAKVLDAGTTPNGLPFFVMELVHGLPLTEYCDQRQLSPSHRLELFVSVCRGIQHAHQKGIIHRDLKPSNILVAEYDERPIPKIIDFGVAKAVSQQLTDKTLFTEFGQIIGTLEYMSPEQAKRNQLDVDTRSDIYSLGIVLYALLTGETPFGKERLKQAAWDEMLRIIREEEPLRPSVKLSGSQRLSEVATNRQMEPARLTSALRGDLDWIVMKSLEKDRSRRYASASELADDVTRHLAAQPVLARPPSTFDRLSKFVRRNRRAAFSGGAAIVAALAALAWTARAINQENAKTAARSMRVSEAIEQASLALGQATNAPISQSAEWIAVNTSTQHIDDLLHNGPVDEEVQQRANTLLATIKKAKADRELAEVIEEVILAGATNMNLESWDRMEHRLRELFRKHGMDLDELPPPEVARRIREHPFASRWVDALELWVATRGQMQAFGGPRLTAADMQPWADAMYAADPDPLRTGIRRQIYNQAFDAAELDRLVDQVDMAQQSSRALAWLAVGYMAAGAPAKADDTFKLALRQFPQDVMLNYDYALTLTRQGRHQEAIRIYHRCVALRPDVPGLWNSLADLLDKLEETEAAEEARAQANELTVSEDVAG